MDVAVSGRSDSRSGRRSNNENEPPSIMSPEQRLEPSAHVVSKVNAILFKSDQGPVSNLLQDSLNHEDEDDAFPPPPTSEIQFPRPNGISPQRSPLPTGMSPQRSIHFDSTSMATSYVLDDEIVQLRHTAAIVANLQVKLKEAKQQAADERTARKRKEKNLIKLAKEMNSRNQQHVKVDKKMEEMEETIHDLEERLAAKSRELPRLQNICEQKEMAIHAVQATSERHFAELEQAKREARLAREELLLVIANNTAKEPESCLQIVKTAPSSSSWGFLGAVQLTVFYTILILMASIAFLRSNIVHPDVLNIVCAPMASGSYVPAGNDVQTFAAPYWAPALYRRELFSVLCPGRGHTILKQVRWKVEILRDGERVWKGRAGGGFHVYDNKIVMMGRRHQAIDTIQGPWTL